MNPLRIRALTVAILVSVAPMVSASAVDLFGGIHTNKEWIGDATDRAQEVRQPFAITNQRELDSLWKKWAAKGEVPTVNFDKEIVIVVTTRSGMPKITTVFDRERGQLWVGVVSFGKEMDGFRYVIATINREGIKRVNFTQIK